MNMKKKIVKKKKKWKKHVNQKGQNEKKKK